MPRAIADLIDILRSAPNCDIQFRDSAAEPWVAPRNLPDDLNVFCAAIKGGTLFYAEDSAVPQSGIRLSLLFAEPINRAGIFEGLEDYLEMALPRFDTLFELGDSPESEGNALECIDLAPERFGRVYTVGYDFGDPNPMVGLIARSFSEWLENLIDAGMLHTEDWRAALNLARDRVTAIRADTQSFDEASD